MSDIVITDLIQATWDDARREADPARKAQLERDAAALEDVWRRSKYALAPTREQFQAALGNTTLNIADTLAALASGQRQVDERVGEMHEYVQQNNTLFSAFFETFPPQFTAFQAEMRLAAQESSTRLGKLEQGQIDYNTRLTELDSRHGGQWEELSTSQRALAQRLDRKREELDRIHQEIEAFKIFKADVEQRIARALPEDETQQLIALLRQIAAERGGDNATG